MSKKTKQSRTPTSEYNYLEEAKHNNGLAEEWLSVIFPELNELRRLMQRFDIQLDDIFEFMYGLKTVRNHGYGNVQITVFEGQVTKIESVLRTIRLQEENKTLPKVKL